MTAIFRIRAVTLSLLLPLVLASPLAAAKQGDPDLELIASLYEEALVQFNKGEVSTSIIHLKNALQTDPSFLAGHILLGRAYLKQGYFSLAEKELKMSERLGADRALIVAHLAESYLYQFKFEALLDDIHPGDFDDGLNAKILEARGKAYLQLGRSDEASQELSDAIRLAPERAAPLLGQAAILISQGDFVASKEQIARAEALEPNNADIWYVKGGIEHAQRQFDQAVHFYSRALTLKPDHFSARLARAEIYLGRGEKEQALEEFSSLYDAYPQNPQIAYLSGVAIGMSGDMGLAKARIEQARGLLDEMRREYVLSHGPTLFLSGRVHYDLGNFEKALVDLTSFVSRHPRETRAYKILAAIYVKKGSISKAISLLEKSLEYVSEDFQVLTALGDAYMQKGRYLRATEMFNKAAELSPLGTQVKTKLGISQMSMGQVDQGVRTLTEIVEANSRAGEAGVILAITALKSGKDEEALRLANLLFDKSPENPSVANLLAITQVANGDRAGARETYRNILREFPEFYPARLNLAKLNITEENYQLASQQLMDMLQEQPKNIQLMVGLARVELGKDNVDKAREWLEKAHAHDPQSVMVGTLLVDVYIRSGNAQQALTLAQKLRVDNIDAPKALIALGQSHLALSQPLEAKAAFRRASQLAGYDAMQLKDIALLRNSAGDLQGAIHTLEKAKHSRPDAAEYRGMLAELYITKGQFELASDEILWLEQQGWQTEAARLRGDLDARQGNFEQAIKHYQRSLSAQPSSHIAQRVFRTYLVMKQEPKALTFVEQWIADHPEDHSMRNILAQGYLRRGDLSGARKEFEHLKEQGLKTAEIYNNLAIIYFKQGDPQAIDQAQRAFALDPERAEINDTLGWLLVNAGEAATGLRYLRSAHARSSTNPEIRYHLAYALYQLQRYQEAFDELGQALAQGRFSGYPQAKALQSKLAEKIAVH